MKRLQKIVRLLRAVVRLFSVWCSGTLEAYAGTFTTAIEALDSCQSFTSVGQKWLFYECYEVYLERVASLSKPVDSSFSVTPATRCKKNELYSKMDWVLATDDTVEDAENSNLETIEPSVIVSSL